MTPGLLLPLALAALAALAMPVVIHIARRTETRTVDFAALRWLEPRPRPRLRPLVDERLLLAVRLLLLAALALWLARPVLFGAGDDRPVVALVPGVQAEAIQDTAPGARRVWLAPGFPEVGGEVPATPAEVVSLIRQLDAELAPDAPLQIVAPPMLEGADAQRPRLSRAVSWRVAEAGDMTPRLVPAPPSLAVRHDAETLDDVRYFRAAAAAWAPQDAEPAFEAAPADQPVGGDRILIWLPAGPLPEQALAWIRAGGAALLSQGAVSPLEDAAPASWLGADGEPVVTEGAYGAGRVLQLTRPLEPERLPQLIEPDFPDRLEALLAPPPPPTRVRAADHAPRTGAAAYPRPPSDLRPWLGVLITLIFGLERWLATRRRRSAAP